MPQKYALRTGRKFKNIGEVYESGRKRSSHWSIKPELNFRELDLEEDAEKIQLDQNYKAFVEDDEIPTQSKKENALGFSELSSVSNKKIEKAEKRSKASKLALSKDVNKRDEEKMRKYAQKILENDTSRKSGKMERKNKKRKRAKKRTEKSKMSAAKSSKNSFYQHIITKSPLTKVDLPDSSAGQGTNRFSTADIKSNIQPVESLGLISNEQQKGHPATLNEASSLVKETEISKRSAENDVEGNLMKQKYNQRSINEAVKRARIAVNNLQSRKQGVAKLANRPGQIRPVVSRAGKVQRNDVIDGNLHNKVQQKNLQDSRSQALKLLRNSANVGKGQLKNGVLGDQPSKNVINKMKNNSQVKPANQSPVNHAKAPSASPTISRGFSPTKEAQISQRARIESPHGEIEKPKEKMKIVPANVARAVAMAMEQLKRDRMWGKVFVHVLPSGKLKVMVQETKKMPDE